MSSKERISDPKIMEVFHELYSSYGPQHWWPGDSQIEVIIGAVLTQNTAWKNVSKAIENLKKHNLLDHYAIINSSESLIKCLIKPAGFYNVKYHRLINLLTYLDQQGLDKFTTKPIAEARSELLSINGIGPETADSILLYAFERPVFVVDAYTRRLFSRLGHSWMEKSSYDEVQKFFMDNLPSNVKIYNEYHALIVKHCVTLCRRRPICSLCKLTCQFRC